MSNMIAFRMAEERAKKAEEKRQTFNQDITIEIPAPTILFVSDYIEKMHVEAAQMRAYIKRLEKLANIAV